MSNTLPVVGGYMYVPAGRMVHRILQHRKRSRILSGTLAHSLRRASGAMKGVVTFAVDVRRARARHSVLCRSRRSNTRRTLSCGARIPYIYISIYTCPGKVICMHTQATHVLLSLALMFCADPSSKMEQAELIASAHVHRRPGVVAVLEAKCIDKPCPGARLG